VMGVILNLAIWFGLHVLFRDVREVSGWGLSLDVPVVATVNWASLILTLAAAVAIFRFKLGVIPVLLGCAAIGIGLHLTGLPIT
jgi:chromate transporter